MAVRAPQKPAQTIVIVFAREETLLLMSPYFPKESNGVERQIENVLQQWRDKGATGEPVIAPIMKPAMNRPVHLHAIKGRFQYRLPA